MNIGFVVSCCSCREQPCYVSPTVSCSDASWARFSRYGASWARFSRSGAPCNKKHYFTNPMFNISIKMHARVRFLKIMNIGFVVSCCSCREQPCYDFRALERPGQEFRAMGRLGLDFHALGHQPATKSIILQTL